MTHTEETDEDEGAPDMLSLEFWYGAVELNSPGPSPELSGTYDYIRADLLPTWQPIETAPKDGRDILVCWGPDYVIEMAMWDIGTKQFVYSVWREGPLEDTPIPFCETPTHWMPLPDLPTKPTQKEPTQ